LDSKEIDDWTPDQKQTIAMMTSEKPSETYWKMYTEERDRLVAVKRNELLNLYQIIAGLKEENRRSKESVDEIKRFSETVNEVLADEQDSGFYQ